MITTDALRNALEDAEAGLIFAGAEKLEPVDDFVPTPLLALRNVRTALAALSQQAAQEPQPVAEVAAGKYGNRLMWHTEDAQIETPVGTKLYADAPAKRAEKSKFSQHHYAGLLEGIAERNTSLTEQERGHLMDAAMYLSNLGDAKPAEQEKAVEHALYEAGKMLDVAAHDSEHPEIWRLAAQMIQSAGKPQQAPSTAAREMQKKAARYEWLRSQKEDFDLMGRHSYYATDLWSVLGKRDDWDAAIDAALAHKGAQEGEKGDG